LFFDPRRNAPVDIQLLDLHVEEIVEAIEAVHRADNLEKFLLFSRWLGEMGGKNVRELIRIFSLQRGQNTFCGKVVGEFRVLLEELYELNHVVRDGLILGRMYLHTLDPGHQAPIVVLDVDQACATEALDHDLDVSRGELQVLDDPRDDTQAMNVIFGGLVDLRITLGREKNLLIGPSQCAFEGHHRRPPSDHERRHHVGIDHHVPQRNCGKLNG